MLSEREREILIAHAAGEPSHESIQLLRDIVGAVTETIEPYDTDVDETISNERKASVLHYVATEFPWQHLTCQEKMIVFNVPAITYRDYGSSDWVVAFTAADWAWCVAFTPKLNGEEQCIVRSFGDNAQHYIVVRCSEDHPEFWTPDYGWCLSDGNGFELDRCDQPEPLQLSEIQGFLTDWIRECCRYAGN